MVNSIRGLDATIVPDPGQNHTKRAEGCANTRVSQDSTNHSSKARTDCPMSDRNKFKTDQIIDNSDGQIRNDGRV